MIFKREITSLDQQILKRSLFQAALVFGTIFLIFNGLMLFLAFKANATGFVPPIWILIISTSIFLMLTYILVDTLLLKTWRDYRSTQKNVVHGIIDSKSDSKEWGWTANPVVDFKNQAVMEVFEVLIDGERFELAEEEFKKLKTGDEVELYYSSILWKPLGMKLIRTADNKM